MVVGTRLAPFFPIEFALHSQPESTERTQKSMQILINRNIGFCRVVTTSRQSRIREARASEAAAEFQ